MTLTALKSAPAPSLEIFDAERFCRAWLTISVAMSDNPDEPGYRQMLVERYDTGFQLLSNCGYLMLRAFVPDESSEEIKHRWPDVDELPSESFIVSDSDKRADALLKYALKTMKPADAPAQSISVRLGQLPAEPGQFDAMASRAFEIEFPAGKTISESVSLHVIEGEPMGWRELVASSSDSDPIEGIRLSPTLVLKRLAALATYWPLASVDLEFRGRNSAFRIEVPIDFCGVRVSGVAMPQYVSEEDA